MSGQRSRASQKSFVSAIAQIESADGRSVVERLLDDDALNHCHRAFNRSSTLSKNDEDFSQWESFPCPNDKETVIHRWTFPSGKVLALIAVQHHPIPTESQPTSFQSRPKLAATAPQPKVEWGVMRYFLEELILNAGLIGKVVSFVAFWLVIFALFGGK